jgi:hypothetical protein
MAHRNIITGLIAASLLATPAQAADFCSAVAGVIRKGALDRLPRQSYNRSLMDGLAAAAPRLVKLNDQVWNDTVPAPFKRPEGTGVTYQPMGSSGVVALGGVAGTMHCTNFKFYRKKTGKAVRFPSPAILKETDEPCWSEAARMGSVQGVPTVFVENEASKYIRTLSMMQLRGRGWGKQCNITVNYRHDMRVYESSCKAGKCSAALQEVALRIADNHENKRAQPDRLTDARGARMTAMLKGEDVSDVTKTPLPEFRGEYSNGYVQFWKDSKTLPVLLDGKPAAATVGGGWWGWRDYPGLLVGFWLWDKNDLHAFAGFQILYAQDKVTSVMVDRKGRRRR